jgi:hypothetical protein
VVFLNLNSTHSTLFKHPPPTDNCRRPEAHERSPHTLTPYLFRIHFNIILDLYLGLPSDVPPSLQSERPSRQTTVQARIKRQAISSHRLQPVPNSVRFEVLTGVRTLRRVVSRKQTDVSEVLSPSSERLHIWNVCQHYETCAGWAVATGRVARPDSSRRYQHSDVKTAWCITAAKLLERLGLGYLGPFTPAQGLFGWIGWAELEAERRFTQANGDYDI